MKGILWTVSYQGTWLEWQKQVAGAAKAGNWAAVQQHSIVCSSDWVVMACMYLLAFWLVLVTLKGQQGRMVS